MQMFYGLIKEQDTEQFRCRTLYFNCYLDRIILLSNWICPKARDTSAKLNDLRTILSQNVLEIDTNHKHSMTLYNIVNIFYIIAVLNCCTCNF
jgi:hypothetical protein